MATKSQNNRGYSNRAGDLIDLARREATTSRLVAAGTLAAGAAAYAVFSNPARRERIKDLAQGYVDRANAWWQGEQSNQSPSAAEIPVSE